MTIGAVRCHLHPLLQSERIATESGGSDELEVQSECKGGPSDSLDSLEEVLPIKKSISGFYLVNLNHSPVLSDAALCPSIQEITKPEYAYTRRRKNLLALNYLWEKNHNSISRSHNGEI